MLTVRSFRLVVLVGFASACALTPRPELVARVDAVRAQRVLADVVSLCELGPRANGDPAVQLESRAWLREQFEGLDWQLREQTFEGAVDVFSPNESETERDEHGDPVITGYSRRTERRPMVNLFAERRGAQRPDHWVELSAHYDTVGGTVGASDNASGVAALLGVARALDGVRTRDSVRLCFFTLEEQRLQGSRAHVEWLLETLADPAEQFRGLLNLDPVGYTDRSSDSQRTPVRIWLVVDPPRTADFVAVVGNWSSAGLAADVGAVFAAYAPDLRRYATNYLGSFTHHAQRSDHANYWKAGLPATWLNDTGEFRSPHYHQPTDTPETIDAEFIAAITRGAAAWALERAGELVEP